MSETLWEAVINKDEKRVRELLNDPKVDVNAKHDSKNPAVVKGAALHAAAMLNLKEILALLLAHPKIDVNILTETGHTALRLAVDIGNLEACHQLMPVTNVLLQPRFKPNPYFLAKGRHKEATSSEEKQITQAILNLLRIPTFIHACINGNLIIVKDMVEKEQVDINACYKGAPALHHACLNVHVKVMDYLLTRPGIDVNQFDSDGRGILSKITAPVGMNEIIEKNKNKKPTEIPFPLVKPSTNDMTYREYMAKKLIEAGANVNLRCQNDLTPVASAAIRNALDLLKIYVEEGGADLTLRYQSGDPDYNPDVITIIEKFRPEVHTYLTEGKLPSGAFSFQQTKKILSNYFKNENKNNVLRPDVQHKSQTILTH